ncbi:MAG: hypothetical protein K940chlam3_00510 [Chlamydiae bacterium]|nr:hypothetical protein [Chlamydiota bacterium]
MKKSKRCITLLELLIAIGLMSILLTALLGYYEQSTRAQVTIQKALQKNFQFLYTQYRLNQIIPTTLNPGQDTQNVGIYFFTKPAEIFEEKSQSLIFTYDNGTGAGSLFSNEVLGKLFVDQHERLVLLTWPAPKRSPDPDPPMRTEVLQENVEKLDFIFYKPIPPEKKRLRIDPERVVGDYDKDLPSWSSEEKDLPALIRILVKIKDREEPIEYAFLLSNTSTPVNYP